jgi:hypothetical protein
VLAHGKAPQVQQLPRGVQRRGHQRSFAHLLGVELLELLPQQRRLIVAAQYVEFESKFYQVFSLHTLKG